MTVRIVDKPQVPRPNDVELWSLTKKGHRVDAKMRVLEHGLELRIELDGGLHYSRLYQFDKQSGMNDEAAEHNAAWQARGWTEHAPKTDASEFPDGISAAPITTRRGE